MGRDMTIQQRAAKGQIRSDLRYLFTIMQNTDRIKSNYIVSMMLYQSLVIDGAEPWVSAINNASPDAIDAPRFTQKEKILA